MKYGMTTMNKKSALWTRWCPLWRGAQANESAEPILTARVTDKLPSCVMAQAPRARSSVIRRGYLNGKRMAKNRSSSMRRTEAVNPVADHHIRYICGQMFCNSS
jgi:hypothetical protein